MEWERKQKEGEDGGRGAMGVGEGRRSYGKRRWGKKEENGIKSGGKKKERGNSVSRGRRKGG